MLPAARELIIPFDESEVAALIDDALAEVRYPSDHARYLIREALRARGRLPGTVNERGTYATEAKDRAG